MYKPVSMDTRRALCRKFSMQCYWEGKESDFELRYTSGIQLEAPPFRTSAKDLAEGGGNASSPVFTIYFAGRSRVSLLLLLSLKIT